MKQISWLLLLLSLLLHAGVGRADDTIRIGIISTVFGYAPV